MLHFMCSLQINVLEEMHSKYWYQKKINVQTNVLMKLVNEKIASVNSVLEQIRIPAITKKVFRRMENNIDLFRNNRSTSRQNYVKANIAS